MSTAKPKELRELSRDARFALQAAFAIGRAYGVGRLGR
jgi:hypothetical protein